MAQDIGGDPDIHVVMQSLGAKLLSQRRNRLQDRDAKAQKKPRQHRIYASPATTLSPDKYIDQIRAKTAGPADTIPRAIVDITSPTVKEALADQMSLSAHQPLNKSCFKSVLERKFNGICELASVLPHLPFVVEAGWVAGHRCLRP